MGRVIHSVESFTERSKVWESCTTVRANLAKLGLPVEPSILYKIETDRGWDAYHIRENQVVAPIDALNEVVKKWNKLLKICETTLFMETQEIIKFGLANSGFVKNLDKYKRTEK